MQQNNPSRIQASLTAKSPAIAKKEAILEAVQKFKERMDPKVPGLLVKLAKYDEVVEQKGSDLLDEICSTAKYLGQRLSIFFGSAPTTQKVIVEQPPTIDPQKAREQLNKLLTELHTQERGLSSIDLYRKMHFFACHKADPALARFIDETLMCAVPNSPLSLAPREANSYESLKIRQKKKYEQLIKNILTVFPPTEAETISKMNPLKPMLKS